VNSSKIHNAKDGKTISEISISASAYHIVLTVKGMRKVYSFGDEMELTKVMEIIFPVANNNISYDIKDERVKQPIDCLNYSCNEEGFNNLHEAMKLAKESVEIYNNIARNAIAAWDSIKNKLPEKNQ